MNVNLSKLQYVLSTVAGSSQLATQVLAPFTNYEDSLQRTSFGLGVITDTSSFLSRSFSLEKKTNDEYKKTSNALQITANVLHYTNIIQQFFPTHPLLSAGLIFTEGLSGIGSLASNMVSTKPIHVKPSEILSNISYMFLQSMFMRSNGHFNSTFYGNIRTHSELKNLHDMLEKVHPSAKKYKLGYMTSFQEKNLGGVFCRPYYIKLSKDFFRGQGFQDQKNVTLHEFAHTFNSDDHYYDQLEKNLKQKISIQKAHHMASHDPSFNRHLQNIYLKAWALDLLNDKDIKSQSIMDRGLRKVNRHSETVDFEQNRISYLLSWYNKRKKVIPRGLLKYDNMSESDQNDFKQFVIEKTTRYLDNLV